MARTSRKWAIPERDREGLEGYVRAGNTPTSRLRLNAVETWFAQVERRSIHRGVFISVVELHDEIHRYIEVHNRQLAKPFQWTKSAEAIIEKHRELKSQAPGSN